MNSETLGLEILSAGLLPGAILPLPLLRGNAAAKYSCYLYLLLPFLCTSWSESRILGYLIKTTVSQISCRDVCIHRSLMSPFRYQPRKDFLPLCQPCRFQTETLSELYLDRQKQLSSAKLYLFVA